MTDTDERKAEDTAQLAKPKKLELKKTVEGGQVRQNFSHGRSKMVTVEVRKKRTFATDGQGRVAEVRRGAGATASAPGGAARESSPIGLTNQEKAARARALQDAMRAEDERAALEEKLAAVAKADSIAAAEAALKAAAEAAPPSAEEPQPTEAPPAEQAAAAPSVEPTQP